MLHKHSSAIAKDATFMPLRLTGASVEVTEPSAPSREERELAQLRRENTELKTQMAILQADWASALLDARQKAREEAARAHVRDDRQFALLLSKSLDQANADFTDQLLAEVGPAACLLAERAFAQLVRSRETDRDWLASMIERRLADVMANAVAVVRIGPLALGDAENGDEAEAAIRAILPAGMALAMDPKLSPGTARIDLRLGSIAMETQAGFTRIRAAFAGETPDD